MKDRFSYDNFFEKHNDKSIYLFGTIGEKSSLEFIQDLFALSSELLEDDNNEKPEICICLNSEGGDLTEMYAICDAIEYVKAQGVIVSIIGLGKIMSAGLMILASGSKGYRILGRNTRLMLHEIQSDYSGSFNDIKTEFEETKYVQQVYIKTLTEITKRKPAFFEKYLKNKANYYFTPEEAIEWGLADKVLETTIGNKK